MEARVQREETLRASQQAVEWLSTLEDAGPAERQAFVDWLGRSSLHVQEFLVLSALDRYLDHVPADYEIDVVKLRSVATPRVHPFASDHQPPQRRKWNVWASAAALTLIAFTALWTWRMSGWQSYSTGIGEQRAVELQDGSVVHLNARSAIGIRFSAAGRDIRLDNGEALFKVKHDARRPFRVYAADTVIQAVGTEFNVYRRKTEIAVAVVEGEVLLSEDGKPGRALARSLAAGEEARVLAAGAIEVRTNADLARATAWRQRRLIFDATPLPEIAEEFNRYNRRPRLRIDGELASQRRFTGVFDADDPESLIELLARDPQLQLEQAGDEVVVRGR